MFILTFFSVRNYHLALQLRASQNFIFLSLMLNCFSKYLKIYKITKVSQRNFALVNNFGFSRKTHHLIKNRLLSSCPNIEENIKVKHFSTQFCLTRFPLNFEKKHCIQKQNQNPQLMTGVCRFRTINLR